MEGTLEEIENLFLLGRFEQAYSACHSILVSLADRTPTPLLSHGVKSRRFRDVEEEEMVMKVVILFIQILFELNRHNEITPFVRWFYANEGTRGRLEDGVRSPLNNHLYGDDNGDAVHNIPFQVFILLINLEVSLQNYQTATDLLRHYLGTPKPTKKGKEKSIELNVQQKSTLAGLLIANILVPTHRYGEARAFLHSSQSTLSPQTVNTLKKFIERAELEEKQKKDVHIPPSLNNTEQGMEQAIIDTPLDERHGAPSYREEHAEPLSFSSSFVSSSSSSPSYLGLVSPQQEKQPSLQSGLLGLLGQLTKRNRERTERSGSFFSVSPVRRSWYAIIYSYYSLTLLGGMLGLFWFMYSKRNRLRSLRETIAQNFLELMGSAFSYDRTSLNQTTRPRRRLGQ